ncbi:MAG: aldo/keto reductase [Spirochaetota bacterium]
MHEARESRYETMKYNNCGGSGLKLPAISLGIWHNFGDSDSFENARAMVRRAFDLGITHFDAANNYGPPPGSAEENFGRILEKDLRAHRDELIISSKAGYLMWPGPYGDWGSKKYLVSSLDQSLKRLDLEYVDIFYHHRPDPSTPLEETMAALDLIVRQGKALYVGISNYRPDDTLKASRILKALGTPCVIHQPNYSMLDRWVEKGLLEVLETESIGCIAFSPLYKGILTNRYFDGIPEGSRASGKSAALKSSDVTEALVGKVRKLDAIAKEREQSMAQMALSWVLRDKRISSALIGASSPGQIEECVAAVGKTIFASEELGRIEAILAEGGSPKAVP